MSELTILLDACPVTLLPHRAAVLRPSHTLVLSDTHWGRDHTLRAIGSPVPSGALGAQLHRLGALIDLIRPAHVVVVGDLIHHGAGLTPGLIADVARFRTDFPVPMTLVRGNHDRWLLQAPDEWDVRISSHDLKLDGVLLAHDPADILDDRPAICGHLHPTVAVGKRRHRLRVPCFHLAGNLLHLPAFCVHTGGPPVERRTDDRAFAIARDQLIEVR